MQDLGMSFWLQLIAYAVSIGCMYGMIRTQISSLTKQVEKHNSVIERVYKLEGQVKEMSFELGRSGKND